LYIFPYGDMEGTDLQIIKRERERLEEKEIKAKSKHE
jgi:hypothetical protein